MTLGERVKRCARNKFLGDPSFELDAMGAVSGRAVIQGGVAST